MSEVKRPTPIILSWFVQAIPDKTKPEDVKRTRPARCSGEFIVREAADEYARLMRKWSRYPDSVEVVSRMGFE